MTGPLGDIKVLDFSTLLPGPMATLFLAEAGAEVIKVERPGRGEDMRSYLPKWGADSANFNLLNRGKKSIAVDLKDPEQLARLRPLLQSADVIIEQFRPGVMKRLGLGYQDVLAINPDIIFCSITGYGQDGPKSKKAGHDLNYIGDSGMLGLSCGTTETPVIPPALIADIAGGTYPAVLNILLALRERDNTGSPSHIDISMSDNLFPFLYWAMGEGQVTESWPGNGDALVTGGSCRYRLYATADGKFVAAAPIETKFWMAFTKAIGLPKDLCDDSLDISATTSAIEKIISQRSANEWEPIFDRADCCCTIIKTLSEAMQDAHFRSRGVFSKRISNEQGSELAALPTPIAQEFASRASVASAPVLGVDNDLLGNSKTPGSVEGER
jgi:crotonobetainyl-CoA:carnitine CoA-transferase CaiB-like acyl-CoA transferase